MWGVKSLKRIAELVRNETVGQVVPDLPAEGRALLLRWHDVRVRNVNSARFRLQRNKTQTLLAHRCYPRKAKAAGTELGKEKYRHGRHHHFLKRATES